MSFEISKKPQTRTANSSKTELSLSKTYIDRENRWEKLRFATNLSEFGWEMSENERSEVFVSFEKQSSEIEMKKKTGLKPRFCRQTKDLSRGDRLCRVATEAKARDKSFWPALERRQNIEPLLMVLWVYFSNLGSLVRQLAPLSNLTRFLVIGLIARSDRPDERSSHLA